MSQNPMPARGVRPGRILRREIEARGWTQKDLAEIMGRPPQVISEIVNGTKQITPETALELGQALGTSPEFWTNLEAHYQLWHAKRDETAGKTKNIARKSLLYSLAPISEIRKRRWIAGSDSPDELQQQVFSFLGISSPEEMPQLAVEYRASAARTPEAYAQVAWVRRVQQLASQQTVAEFHIEQLSDGIADVLTCAARAEDIKRVPEKMAALGIHFVLVPHLPKTYLDGAAFFLRDHPVIALTLRHDRIDAFWFTLMHELAHILSHDPAVYVDDLDQDEASQDERERQANRQARDWLVDAQALRAFVRETRPYFSRARIVRFAEAQARHPGIVLGRLQYEEVVEYKHLRSLLVKVKPLLKEWLDVPVAP